VSGAAVLAVAALVALTEACSRRAALPEIAKTSAADSGSRPRWPKIGRLAGTAEQLGRLATIPGVTVDDHGQRKLGAGRWEVGVTVSDDEAVEELRRLGLAPALREPIVADPDSVPR
jgi:hypothetical protein